MFSSPHRSPHRSPHSCVPSIPSKRSGASLDIDWCFQEDFTLPPLLPDAYCLVPDPNWVPNWVPNWEPNWVLPPLQFSMDQEPDFSVGEHVWYHADPNKPSKPAIVIAYIISDIILYDIAFTTNPSGDPSGNPSGNQLGLTKDQVPEYEIFSR